MVARQPQPMERRAAPERLQGARQVVGAEAQLLVRLRVRVRVRVRVKLG